MEKKGDIQNKLNEYFSIVNEVIELEDTESYNLIKQQIPLLINEFYKQVFLCYYIEKVYKIIYYLTNELLFELSKRNLCILNAEIKTIIFLKNNISYLDSIDDIKNIYNYINTFKDIMNLDIMRQEYVELNSNKGRTILSDYKLDNIVNVLNELNIYVSEFTDDDYKLNKKKINGGLNESF